MSALTTIKLPNPSLRERSKEVEFAEIQTSDFQKLIDDMMETMKVENGVGLAAPQIGLGKRLIVVETPRGPMAFVNPTITKESKRLVNSEEGCLSVPGVFGIVKRHKHIKIKALDRTGKKIEIKAGGLTSIIFQHEIDHLDGILFIDKAERIVENKENDETII